jgi:hypothetical protein
MVTYAAVNADEFRVDVSHGELMHRSESSSEGQQRGIHLDHPFVTDNARELVQFLLPIFLEKVGVCFFKFRLVADIHVSKSLGEAFLICLHVIVKDAVLRQVFCDFGVPGACLLCRLLLALSDRRIYIYMNYLRHTPLPPTI